MRKCLIYLEFPEKYIAQLKKIANRIIWNEPWMSLRIT